MALRINSTAYMDVSAAGQNQPIQAKESDPTIKEPINQSTPNEKIVPAGIPIEVLQMEIDRIREQSFGADKGLKVIAKCMRIAMRIVQGDNVPPKDDEYLAEHDPELHMRAWMMRVPKADPKNHDSEFEDEENDLLREMLDLISGGFEGGSGGIAELDMDFI